MSNQTESPSADIVERARATVRSTFTDSELCRMVDKNGVDATVDRILATNGNDLLAEKSDGDVVQSVRAAVNAAVTTWAGKDDARSYPRPPTRVGSRVTDKTTKTTYRTGAGRELVEAADSLPPAVVSEIREAVMTLETGRTADVTRRELEAAVDFLDSSPVSQRVVDRFYSAVDLPDLLGPSGPDVEPRARRMRRSDTDTPDKNLTKDYTLRSGLTWTEQITVREVRRDEGIVVMQEEMAGSKWEETVEKVTASLRALEEREHDWMYHLVAGEYPNLTAQEVHEMLHNAAGLPSHEITSKHDPADTTDRKAVEDGYTLREGLSWTEGVVVLSDNPDTGKVVMKDTLTGMTWTESREKIQEKLDMLEGENHEWLYELVSGEYPTLDAEDAERTLHREARIIDNREETDTQADAGMVDEPDGAKRASRTVIVAEKEAAPVDMTLREREDGLYEYEV